VPYQENPQIKAGHRWFMPVILVAWEAEFMRIMVQGQPRQIVHKTLSPKISRAKWTAGVAQVVELLLCKP
jgi:hypothetical protein